MNAQRSRYDSVAMALHWIIAVLMIFMIFFGEDLIRQPRGAGSGAVNGWPSLHVSIGIAILLLSMVRFAWRLVNPPPPYPPTMKAWEVALAKITHGLFYVLLIGLPITGWLAFGGYLQEHANLSGTMLFGLFPVPAAPSLGEWAEEVHGLGSNVAMALLFLHVAAAFKHQFVDRDGLFWRMLPH